MFEQFSEVFRPQTVLSKRQRETATLAIGQPGCGKSRGLESWSWQDIEAGHGVAVLDPAGDLYDHLLRRLANRRDLWHRVVLINPCDDEHVVYVNPLAPIAGVHPERIALFMTDIVIKIWKIDPTQAPRMVWVMTYAFLALTALNRPLLDLPKLLLNRKWRDEALKRLPNDLKAVKTFFTMEYPKTLPGARMWSVPILNKIGGLLFDRDVREMLSGTPALDFRRILDNQLIVLARLSKGELGEETANLLGAFIVAQFQKAALSRSSTSISERSQYFLYLDEFQNYTTDNIQDILAESRKYGLTLTLAHQYLAQLSPELKAAVLNTAGTLACFRVGYDDAKELAGHVFPSWEFSNRNEMRLTMQRSGSYPTIRMDEWRATPGSEQLAQQLANQQTRQFWMRRKGPNKPVQLRTMDCYPPEMSPDLEARIRELRALSAAQFGNKKVGSMAHE